MFGNWAPGSSMPRRYDASVCGEQLLRRGELLGLLRAGWEPPAAGCPGTPRSPGGAGAIPRTPAGGPIVVSEAAPSAPAPGHGRSLGQVRLALQEAVRGGTLLGHVSALGDATLHVARSLDNLRAKCGFVLPVGAQRVVCLSDAPHFGYSVCGRACFGIRCAVASLLASQ
ncbi:unnamed protein product [Prorocentrum cordatum]|uniref:Uncharacterized protein n=1 Tax=Prorocentrum cordatum TaxID=2364126 RepID=A0ABN9SKU7_9DINO|nr:unnamed protein product [Polarella glacialis]